MSQQDLGALQLKGAVEAIQNQRNQALDQLADAEGRVAMLTETLKTCTETINKLTEENKRLTEEKEKESVPLEPEDNSRKPRLKAAPTATEPDK